MATLHVRDVPDNLYEEIQQVAAMENRSISAQVIVLLSNALTEMQAAQKQKQLLMETRRRRTALAADWAQRRLKPINTTELIREDRDE